MASARLIFPAISDDLTHSEFGAELNTINRVAKLSTSSRAFPPSQKHFSNANSAPKTSMQICPPTLAGRCPFVGVHPQCKGGVIAWRYIAAQAMLVLFGANLIRPKKFS